jgi:uncharacterized protein (DUF1330 family)
MYSYPLHKGARVLIQIVVLLYVGEGGVTALREHEAEMAPIIYRHGGQIISASHPSAPQAGDPDEIQILQFPDMKAFNDFRNDPDSLSKMEQRRHAIRDARVYITDQFVTYID